MPRFKNYVIICITSIIFVCGVLCIAAEALSMPIPFIGVIAHYQGEPPLIDQNNGNVQLIVLRTPLMTPFPSSGKPGLNKKIDAYKGSSREPTPKPLLQQVQLFPCNGLAPEEIWTKINENILRKCVKKPMCSQEGYFQKFSESCTNVPACSDDTNKGLNVAGSDSPFTKCRPDSIITPTVVITFNPVTQEKPTTPPYSNYQLPTMNAPNTWVAETSTGLKGADWGASPSITNGWSSGGWATTSNFGNNWGGGGSSTGGGASGTPTFECPPGATCSFYGSDTDTSTGSSGTVGPGNPWAAFHKIAPRNTSITRTKENTVGTITKKIFVNVTGTEGITPVVTSSKKV